MNRVQSEIPPQFGNWRKRGFLERAEAYLNEDDRPKRLNAAYRESDRVWVAYGELKAVRQASHD